MTLKTNTIYNEDCLKTMAKMPAEYIDLIVTSPPYDDIRDYNGYSFKFEEVAQSLRRVIKVGGVVVWVVGSGVKDFNESLTPFKQAIHFQGIGFNVFDTMIYQKTSASSIGSHYTYNQTFEYMFVLSKGKPKTINLISDIPNTTYGTTRPKYIREKDGTISKPNTRFVIKEYGKRGNVWKYYVGARASAQEKFATKHPAIFPEKLAQDHIISWSNKGDLVYDPFMGSGTVAKMCDIEGRKYIGSEISAEYCEIIKQRLMQERFQSCP